MVTPILRALIDAEESVLRRHGISMWGYIVLSALRHEDASSQAALAESIGADKSRIIAVLDELQSNDWINRVADPADRRIRLVSATAAGERVRTAVQRDIQQQENRLLAELSANDSEAFVRVLRLLAAQGRAGLSGVLLAD